MAMEIEYECPKCDTPMTFQVDLGYSTAHIRNPNHPSYADPGDPGYVDGPDTCPNCQEKIDHDKVMEKAAEQAADSGPDEPDFDDDDCYSRRRW